MDDRILKVRHSYHFQETPKSAINSDVCSKSNLNMALSITHIDRPRVAESIGSSEEYYKRYEHDEVPVKDSTENFSSKPGDKTLTDSDLEKLEKRIYKNVSQELQTDDGSLSSLESNIKFFKTTVEKIFDNFYTSMRDFEHYKNRFDAILERSKDGSMDDMEEFIKDMFEHIENSASNISGLSKKTTHTVNLERRVPRSGGTSCSGTYTEPNLSTAAVSEAYKNDHYLTDSTLEETTQRGKRLKIEEIFNIFLLGGDPCVHIKMNDRKLLSEMKLKAPSEVAVDGSTASADNLKKLAAKRLEVERYVRQQNHSLADRDIPVRVSNAKKNIYLNEDFARNDSSDTSKSFISKICNILCKKFRKGSFL